MDILDKLTQLPAIYAQLADDLAEKEAKFKNLEEQKKAVLAKLEMEFDWSREKKTSQAEIQRNALASDKWHEYVKGLNQARTEYLQAKAKLNSRDVQLDCLRSINSYTKAEMNIR